MRTIKLTLSYDGTDFAGWQAQRNGPTVQATLEDTIEKITGLRSSTLASGRTDAGVHALGQVVSFRTESRLPAEILVRALNAELPRSVIVLDAAEVHDGFHATHDALRKRYRYVIDNGPFRDVFARRYAWHFACGRLDVDAMQRAAAPLVGTHDFSSFETTGAPRKTSVRTVFDLRAERGRGEREHFIALEVEANGFLYNMVRTIVGTLVDVGRGRPPGGMAGRSAASGRSPPGGQNRAAARSVPRQGRVPGMRIAHIITRLILGGAQENVVFCCEDLLRDFGDEVLLITGPPLGPEGSLLDRARAGGIPLAIIPSLQRAIHPWRDIAAYRAIGKSLREFSPHVVHTHSAKAGILGRAAAWRMQVPAIVHTVHGAPFHAYQSAIARSVFRGCERWAAGRCHALVSVADAMTDLLVNAEVAPREKFTTIYSGMEVEPLLESHRLRDAMRSKLGYRPEHVVVGKIARLFHLKGHEYLIEAAKGLVRAQPLVRFLLVGDGLLRDKLEQQILAAGLKLHFKFVGLVPPEEIPALVAAMDIVVHTSLREGLARALVQGVLAGKPVVSFDIDGVREVVIDGVTGYLVPPRDCGALTVALQRLSADPALRTLQGGQGRARFKGQFCHHYMTQEIRNLYARLAKGVTAGELQSPGSGPFLRQNESNSREILGRKHGPDPFALDFAVLLGVTV